MTDQFSVLVTPLQPPFDGEVMFFTFDELNKELAVSKADGEKIQALLNHKPEGRAVVLAPADDDKIRIHISQ